MAKDVFEISTFAALVIVWFPAAVPLAVPLLVSKSGEIDELEEALDNVGSSVTSALDVKPSNSALP